jgi:hypothetical protein
MQRSKRTVLGHALKYLRMRWLSATWAEDRQAVADAIRILYRLYHAV